MPFAHLSKFSICSLSSIYSIYIYMNVKFNRNLRFGHPAPDPRNRPHMHHAIEPWMAQVRDLGTPAATKKHRFLSKN